MRLLLFDIDGTLLAAQGSGRAAFDAVMQAQHGVADASRGISYGGKTDHALIDEIFAARLAREPSEAERDAFLAAYLVALDARLASGGATPLDGVMAALADVRTRDGVIVGIATGNVRAGADLKLRAAAIDPRWFAVGGYGCDAKLRAELVGVAIARGRAAGATDDVVVIGDTVHDITAAHANGALAIAVATGGVPAEVLRDARADAVIASMTELATALDALTSRSDR